MIKIIISLYFLSLVNGLSSYLDFTIDFARLNSSDKKSSLHIKVITSGMSAKNLDNQNNLSVNCDINIYHKGKITETRIHSLSKADILKIKGYKFIKPLRLFSGQVTINPKDGKWQVIMTDLFHNQAVIGERVLSKQEYKLFIKSISEAIMAKEQLAKDWKALSDHWSKIRNKDATFIKN